MSRYIDTKWLEDNAKEYSLGYYESDERATPLSTLDDAPSIDIVRCKECRYFYTEERFGETVHFCKRFNDVRGYWAKIYADDFCSYGSRSEKPNNCEYITEDGVTCAKYPACDDCPDNPLSKVKGSERLVKGTEKPNNSTTEDCSMVGKE